MSRWMPDAIEQWSLRMFREKLIKIGAKQPVRRHQRVARPAIELSGKLGDDGVR